MLLMIVAFTFVIILTNNNVFAQNLHKSTLEEITKQQPSELNTTVHIVVGKSPRALDIMWKDKRIYVANAGSDSISVINSTTNELIKNLEVGHGPTAIDTDFEGTVYVANADSDSISVIDSVVNKIVAGIKLEVNPFNSGYIECEGLTPPISQYFLCILWY
jgi:YVTN family beta-propeller protein